MENPVTLYQDRVSSLQKRDDERQLDLQKKRNDKKLINAENEQYNYFTDIFQDKLRQIQIWLETVQNMGQEDIAFHFDKIFREINSLQKFVTESVLFLRGYDIRICQESLVEIDTKARKLEEQLLPKKKFGFKKKRITKKTDEILKQDDLGDDSNDVVDNLKKTIKFEENFYGFKNQNNTSLSLCGNNLFKKDLTLQNLENCVIKLDGSPSTLHMSSLVNCLVLCGPIATSVFAENCNNCKLVLACQQLRLHSSFNCDIYLHVTSRAIIEDCKNIKMAPYNYVYTFLLEDFKKAGLDQNVNHWKDVDDFNWLVVDKHSPNWSVLDDSDRITNWNTYIN